MNLQLQRVLILSASASATPILSLAFLPPFTRHHVLSSRRNIDIMAEAPACTPGGKCVPCESLDKSHLLSQEQIDAELTNNNNMPLWKKNDSNTKISRSYTARNFQSAMDSMVAIGKIAEREGHHPDMHLTGYRNVEIVLFTHSLGGVSPNDIALAKMIDAEVEFDYSPKWLKSNPEAAKKE